MIGAFAGFVMYAALAANVVTNPTPSLFADKASPEEREKAREVFRALMASAKPPADVAAKAESQHKCFGIWTRDSAKFERDQTKSGFRLQASRLRRVTKLPALPLPTPFVEA
jgi:hypothetical protein